MRLPHASIAVALGSAVSLAAQALFSLLMLRAFTPEAVGSFAAIAQVAFFWMTLALAQSPLRLLADAHVPLVQARSQALRDTSMRLIALLPLAALATLMGGAPLAASLAWAGLLASLQAGWYIAQPVALRTGRPVYAACARALPPLCALLIAGATAWRLTDAGTPVLLASAAAGYAVGCLWLVHVGSHAPSDRHSPRLAHPLQRDSRSSTLRLLHTAADAATGAALLLVWQRVHGAAEAGLLAVLLRLLGMVPVVVHTAWAQVLLAQGRHWHGSPLWAGVAGAGLTGVLAMACAVLLSRGWLPAWEAAMPYLLPLTLWQAAACMHAACSHLPFQQGRAKAFSQAAIAFSGVQCLVLVAPPLLGAEPTAVQHAWALGTASCAGLLLWTAWTVRTCRAPALAADAPNQSGQT